MLEVVYREHELLIYKANIYKGKEEDEEKIQKVVNY